MLSQVYAEYVSVSSAKPKREITKKFEVSIILSSGVKDLYCWEAAITFNPNVLWVLGVENGGFLSSESLTFNISSLDTSANGSQQLKEGHSLFIALYDDIEFGKLSMAETNIGEVPGASGFGTLATITFGVFGQGSYDLQLLDTILLDSNLNPIEQVFLTSPAELS